LKKHPIKEEQERLKEYFKKVKNNENIKKEKEEEKKAVVNTSTKKSMDVKDKENIQNKNALIEESPDKKRKRSKEINLTKKTKKIKN
jgi:hypothetical protein